jgi:hypothetical protein
MELICKKTGPSLDRLKLTIGKKYKPIGHRLNKYDNTIIQSYEVINDEGMQCYYDKSMFITLQEVRDDKLNKLGIK